MKPFSFDIGCRQAGTNYQLYAISVKSADWFTKRWGYAATGVEVVGTQLYEYVKSIREAGLTIKMEDTK
tara:strand:+ start:250 stop:456 length:207 start_codon:yes stop_codon:yes gene_type:complete